MAAIMQAQRKKNAPKFKQELRHYENLLYNYKNSEEDKLFLRNEIRRVKQELNEPEFSWKEAE